MFILIVASITLVYQLLAIELNFASVFLLTVILVWLLMSVNLLGEYKKVVRENYIRSRDILNADFNNVLLGVSDAVQGDAGVIRAQLSRTQKLVGDAILDLGNSFGDLDKQAQYLCKMVVSLVEKLSDKKTNDSSGQVTVKEFVKEIGKVLDGFVDVMTTMNEKNHEAAARMDEIVSSMNSIFAVLDNMKTISDQTNLLALNAAIEAARAGEAGRGFAVVADQVRSLSINSNNLNEKVRENIKQARVTIESARAAIGNVDSRDLDMAIATKKQVTLMMIKLGEMDLWISKTLHDISDTAGKINGDVINVVGSLQFEDLVRQSLEKAVPHIDRIDELLLECNDAAKSGIIQSDGGIQVNLSGLGEKIHSINEKWEKLIRKPACRELSQEGNIELF